MSQPSVLEWLYVVLIWFVHRAGNDVAKRDLQRDPVTVLCPVSLRVGKNVLPGTEVLWRCSEHPAHTSGAMFSKLCQTGASALRAGGVLTSASGLEWSNCVKVSPGTSGAVVDV